MIDIVRLKQTSLIFYYENISCLQNVQNLNKVLPMTFKSFENLKDLKFLHLENLMQSDNILLSLIFNYRKTLQSIH